MNCWLAVCVWLSFDAGPKVDARAGFGIYDTAHMLHARVYGGSRAAAGASAGATDAMRPLPPMRQFLQCN